METKKLTLKDLIRATNAPIYTIQYLKGANRLPIVEFSKGQGYPTYYHSKAIDVIKAHINKRSK